jgi:hypothetical protein
MKIIVEESHLYLICGNRIGIFYANHTFGFFENKNFMKIGAFYL